MTSQPTETGRAGAAPFREIEVPAVERSGSLRPAAPSTAAALQERITQHLRAHSATTDQVADRVGLPVSRVRRQLALLEQRGVIEQHVHAGVTRWRHP